MAKKPKTVKPGRVRKIIKPLHPDLSEKAEIEIHDADHLYREIRIDNALVDEQGQKVKLREHADVDVVIEADPKATVRPRARTMSIRRKRKSQPQPHQRPRSRIFEKGMK